MSDTKSVYADNNLNLDNPHDAWTKLYDLVPAKSVVLDIGCSSGNFGAELIKRKSCTVVGVDINAADVSLAAKRLNRAIVKNIEQEELKDLGTFDVVVMADVIEHLIDPVEVLKKVRGVLRKGGVFVFSVPNMANMATRLELLEGRFEYTKFGILDETHLHYYDRIELEKVLKSAGFSVSKYDTTVRDIPKDFVIAQLEKIGLQAEQKFFDIVNHPDSRAFQFIGVAKPDKGSFAKIRSKTPHDFMSRFIDDLIKRYESDKARLEKELTAEKHRNNRLLSEKEKLQSELTAIHQSKGWKALTAVYTAKHTIKKSIRRKSR